MVIVGFRVGVGWRAVAVLVGLVAATGLYHAWPAPEVRVPRRGVGLRYFPIAGEPLAAAVDEARGMWLDHQDGRVWYPPAEPVPGGCIPFLAPLVAHPNWQLQIDERSVSRLGSGQVRRYVVDGSGRVIVSELGLLDRELQLTADELDRVLALDRGSCAEASHREAMEAKSGSGRVEARATETVTRAEGTGGAYAGRYYELTIGPGDGTGGAKLSIDTAIGSELAGIVGAARARHADHVAATRPLWIHLRARAEDWDRGFSTRTAAYVLEVDAGGLLTVRRGPTELVRRQLDAETIADLADASVDDTAWEVNASDGDPLDRATARGTMRIDASARELVLWPRENSPGLHLLADAIEDADRAWRERR